MNESAGRRDVALVTGASSGIGRDLARILAEHGHDLVLVARGREAMERLAEECRAKSPVEVTVLSADLAEAGAAQRIVDELIVRSIKVDILVNNAGFGTHGRFAQIDRELDLQLLQVNIVALTELTKLLLPGMIQRRRGRVLNVASTAAFVPGPYMSTYYASKAYVLSHSLSLRRELRGKGVSVTVLCPGPTRTAFQERAGIAEVRLFRRGVMDSLAVARAGYTGMMKGRAMVVPGLMNKLVALSSRLAPRRLLAWGAGRLNRDR